jgi:hypothetical protein
MTPGQLTLAISLATIISPLIMALIVGSINARIEKQKAAQRLLEKQQDWERQDKVAADLQAAQERAETAANEAKAIAIEVQKTVNVVHGLANSSYTEQMRSKRIALEGQAVLLQRLRVLTQVEDLKELDQQLADLKIEIKELDVALADRERQTSIGEAQTAEATAQANAREAMANKIHTSENNRP